MGAKSTKQCPAPHPTAPVESHGSFHDKWSAYVQSQVGQISLNFVVVEAKRESAFAQGFTQCLGYMGGFACY
ncbi:hypothetical protein CBS147317_1981 [Penicillium roqueforti]|nr:hypothetical protein CBS147355_1329 [Penicillium roqueforti]KAI2705029.1 hypothetical protein CBS147372_1332 [Penicillium roqueforti]KAI3166038.1 hypothetical protein CBS147317_1981 [Penicillium roqueforti]